MAQFDGSIRILTSIETKAAKKSLGSLSNTITLTAKEISKLRSKMDALKGQKFYTDEYKQLQTDLANAEKKLAEFTEYVKNAGDMNENQKKQVQKRLGQYESEVDGIKAKMKELEDTGKAFKLGRDTHEYANLEKQMRYEEQSLALAKQHLQVAQKLGDPYGKLSVALHDLNKRISGILHPIQAAKSAFSSFADNAKAKLAGVSASLLNAIVHPFQAMKKASASAIKGIASTAKKIGKAMSGVAFTVKNAASSMFRFRKSTKSASTGVSGFAQRIKSLALSALIFNQISKLFNTMISGMKTGFENLYNENENFKNSINGLKASLATLGNSIAAAFAPIVQVAIPYIQQLIGWITKVMSLVGQFIGAITGQKTYTKAVQQSAGAMEDAAGAAGDAEKAMEGYLNPLDEINKMNKKDSSSGGGGGGGGAGGAMFEEVPISDKFKDIAQWFKDMWAKADFTELGTLIGQKLKNALDNIPWNEIKAVARKIGSSLATLINGFVEVEGLGYSIGRTLAEALNTGFNFLNESVHRLHWDSIGHFIADSLNGIFESIDWPLIYDTFVTGFKGLADSINQFITDFRWENISEAISNLVNTISDSIYAFFSMTHFDELGQELGRQISESIRKVKWENVGRAIGVALQSAIDFVKNIIGQIRFSDVVKAVSDTLKNMFAEMNMTDVVSIILSLFVSVLVMKSKTLKLIAVAAAVLSALSDSFKDVDWGSIGRSISNGINQFFQTFDGKSFAQGATSLISGILDMLIEAIDTTDWTEIWKDIIDFIVNVDWGGLTLRLLVAAANLIGGLFGGLIEAIATTDWGDVWSRILDAFLSFWQINSPSRVMAEQGGYIISGLLKGLKDKVGDVINWFKELPDKVKNALGDAKQWLVDKGKGAVEGIKNGWNSVKESGFGQTIAKTGSYVKEKAGDAKQWLQQKGKDAIAGIKSGWESSKESGFLSIVAKIGSQAKTKIGNIGDMVKSKGNDLVTGLKNGYNSGINGFLSTVSSLKDRVRTGLSGLGDIGRNAASSLANAIKSVHIPMPHFSFSTKSYKVGKTSFSLPSVSVNWYKKGGLFNAPSVIGVGEAGSEAVLPLKNRKVMNLLADSIVSRMSKTRSFPTMPIPHLAQGTVVPPNKEFAAILGDNKREPEVVSPISSMKQAFKEALTEMGGMNGNNGTIVIKQYLDGKQITQAVIKEGKVQQMSSGNNPFMLGTT